MAQRIIWLPEIGELVLAKRRGTKNLRLSINAAGRVRVGLPAWAPYSAGISFAKSRQDWINRHKIVHKAEPLYNGARIGKAHRLEYIHDPLRSSTLCRLTPGIIKVKSNLPLSVPSVQQRVKLTSEKALKTEAEKLLPIRLGQLSKRHQLNYKSVRIKKLRSRWGSCAADKSITLNFFLMQLPWQLIDYVLIHELIHTVHLNHSPNFWADFEKALPDAKQARKRIRAYRPIINSPAADVA